MTEKPGYPTLHLIDTAPKDGRRVLIYVPRSPDRILSEWFEFFGWFTAWFERGEWHTGLQNTSDECGTLDDPSHWMELPLSPEGGEN